MSRKRKNPGKPKRLSRKERAILAMREPPKPKGQLSRGTRRGNVFPVRIAPEVRSALELQCARDEGPKALGPWLVWRALVGSRFGSSGNTGERRADADPLYLAALRLFEESQGVLVPAVETARDVLGVELHRSRVGVGNAFPGKVIPAPAVADPPVSERLIVDLCAGSGSWSEPYKAAGYRVKRITLPHFDVHVFPAFDEPVWGVLAAPPCTEFSLAKNGRHRDFRAGLETVSACLRLITAARPRWWALENPVGMLGHFLGRPADVFDPHEYGDPWTKRTALWGSFVVPARGPRVRPIDGGGPPCSVCHPDDPRACSVGDHLAITAPGFARAFCEANP